MTTHIESQCGETCECSSAGRALPCQGKGREFEPHHSLHCEYSTTVSAPAFQAGDVSSILTTRSN